MLYFKYDIFNKVIEKLDIKYQENMNLKSNKTFLYVNSLDILRYYRLSKIKEFDYDLFNKVSLCKKDLMLLNYINVVKNNKYFKSDVTYLYSLCVSLCIDIIVSKYNFDYKDLILLDKFIYNKKIKLNNKYIRNTFKNSFAISFTELDFLKNGLTTTYSFIYTKEYILSSIEEFKNMFSLNPFYKLKQFFFNIFRKKYLKTNNYKYNIRLSKKGINKILKSNIDIDSLTNEAINLSLELINCVNNALYFDKQSSLVEFARKNNWYDIVNYYDYLNDRKHKEKERSAMFKIKQKTKIANQKIKNALKK